MSIILQKKYGNFTAIDSLNFQISHGEIFGLLGPNGAGKTTTIRILCSLLSPSSGSIEIEGLNISTERESKEARKIIGLVPDSPGFMNQGAHTGIFPFSLICMVLIMKGGIKTLRNF